MFKNPIAPKKRTASKMFAAPTKDQAHLVSMVGDDYGSGFRNPVGSKTFSDKKPFPIKPECFHVE